MAPTSFVSLIARACALSINMVYDPVSAAENANVITVGDENGWTLGFDYHTWAASKEFHVGETLVFSYTEGVHNVIMVNGSAFAYCVNEPNLAVYSSGEDNVVLKGVGNIWFICGVGAHCENGMKLKITVTQDQSSASPAPAPAPAPYSGYRSRPWR